MTYFTYIASTTVGNPDFDYAITDILIVDGELYTVSKSNTIGVAHYQIGSDGNIGAGTTIEVASQGLGLSIVGPQLIRTDGAEGTVIWQSGLTGGAVYEYEIQEDGSLLHGGLVAGVLTDGFAAPLMSAQGNTVVLGAPQQNGLTFYTQDETGLTNPIFLADTDDRFLANPNVLTSVTVGESDYFVVGSATERGISVIATADGTPEVVSSFSTEGDVTLMQPTALTVAEVQGQTFVITGSMPQAGESGALTSFSLSEGGQLDVADHRLDTRDTRFGQVQMVESVQINGRTYVVAGGGDNGLSLFALAYDGRLLHLESIEDTVDIGIGGVTTGDFLVTPDGLYFYVASESEAGISHFEIAGATEGLTDYGTIANDVIGGGTQDDWLFGREGDDTIDGAGGDDLISDGTGIDIMSGGAGADLFILSYDGEADTITDFNPEQDRIDLTDWRYVQDPSELSFTTTPEGIVITYRDETLTVRPETGVTLNEENLRDAIIADGARLWEPLPDTCRWDRSDDNQAVFGGNGNLAMFSTTMWATDNSSLPPDNIQDCSECHPLWTFHQSFVEPETVKAQFLPEDIFIVDEFIF